MKIAIISQPSDRVQPPNLNSVGLWTYKVSSILAKEHDVFVYSGQKNLFEYRNGLTFISIPRLSNRTYKLISNSIKIFSQKDFPPFASEYFLRDYIESIAKDLRNKQIEVAHIHLNSQFIPIIRKYNPDIKIILHMHCEWLDQLNYERLLPRLEQADKIIGVSEYLTNLHKTRFPKFADRCETVFNGVDIRHFLPTTKTFGYSNKPTRKILLISRISPEKGIHDLIEAFNIVAIQHPDVELHLIGQKVSLRRDYIVDLSKNPLVRDLERFYNGKSYIESLHSMISPAAKEKIHFLGHIDHTELPLHFRNATILVNPSIVEVFGMSMIESMASAVPVVGTDIGGIPEIIDHGSTGYIVPPASPEKLAGSINQLLSDSLLRSKMGDAGRKRVMGKFTWKAVAKKMNQIYKSL